MRIQARHALFLSGLLLAACKQGDPQPLEALPLVENCSVEDSLVVPAQTTAELGRMVNGAFQPFTSGAQVEVMPFSYDTWLNVPTFVAPVAIRVVPPVNVPETSLCGALGLVSDTFSNYVFHRVGAYLVAEPTLVQTSYATGPLGNLQQSVFFSLGDRTFTARSPDLTVTFVNEVGIGLLP
jgi:hypothetical protein